jgi:hypothetical protein
MFQKEIAQTIFVAVLGTKMAWSISINIFCIDISSSHDYGLDYTQISPDASDVQRCSEITRSSIDRAPELHKKFDQIYMTFI